MRIFFSLLVLSSVGFADEPSRDACSPLTGRTLAYVCNRIQSATITVDCFAAGQSAYLNACALGACDRYNDGLETVGCIRSIANRNYTLEEVLACDRMTSTSDTSQCLAVAGYAVASGGQFSKSVVRSYALDTIDYLRNNKPEEARRVLYELLDYLD